MTIYGREELIGALARSRAPVTLLTGDSGVGKSTVLAAAQHAALDGFAPAPRRVPYSGGALQYVLLQALSDAMSGYVEQRGRAQELVDHMVQVADRLAGEGAQELIKVVVKELLALVRGRIGDDVGKAFAEYLQRLTSTVDERLAARLVAAVDPGVAGLVLDLAAEICDFVGDQQIRLALDAGERLREEDVRLLADLSERLPDQLRLLLAFSTHTDAQQQRVEFLVGAGTGVVEQPIPGLDVESIVRWLVDESLDPGKGAEIARVTGGYGLHLGDLIQHLKHGGSIDDAPLNEVFAHRTNEAWRTLSVDIARHARALCVFADPLPRARLLAFLQLDATTWGAIEDRLWRARILSVTVNEQRWFHEQRRQYLLNEVLGPDERATASSRAAQELYGLADQEGGTQRLGELAILVAAATPLLQADSRLAAAVRLDPDELALAASLIELIEAASSVPAVDGNTLLDYARATFGANGDLIAALRRLEQHGLVVVKERSGAAAAAASFPSGLAAATVAGRAVRELGRLPIPAAASRVFEMKVRPRLGPFGKVQYGLGSPSMAKLSEMAIELRRPPSPSNFVGRTDPGSNLLIRGNYAGRGLYAAATFASASDRDAAREHLAGLSGEILGQRFAVNDLMSHPVIPVASRRFLNAAERLLGKSLGPVGSHVTSIALDHPLAPEEALRRKAAALRTVRERSTELERIAMQLDKPMGYAYFSDADGFLEAEILGGREGVEQLATHPDVGWDDPYAMFRVARMLNLQPHEHLSHMTLRSGNRSNSQDPVVEVLGRLHLHAARFNTYQRQRRKVVLDANWLERVLTAAARRNLEDAGALAATVPLGDITLPPEPRTTYLLVELDRPAPGWVPGAFSHATSVVVPNSEGQEEVRVTLVHRLDEDHTDWSAWFQELGLPGELRDYQYSLSYLSLGLARMLGHKEDELDLAYPDHH